MYNERFAMSIHFSAEPEKPDKRPKPVISHVDALSHVIAVEEGPWGVQSNVIAPGPIAATESKLPSGDTSFASISIVSFRPIIQRSAFKVLILSPFPKSPC